MPGDPGPAVDDLLRHAFESEEARGATRVLGVEGDEVHAAVHEAALEPAFRAVGERAAAAEAERAVLREDDLDVRARRRARHERVVGVEVDDVGVSENPREPAQPRGREVRSPPEPPHFDREGSAPVAVEERPAAGAQEHDGVDAARRPLLDREIEHEALDAADLRAPEVVDDPHGRRQLQARGRFALLDPPRPPQP
jgi:hypothetical protein